MILDKDSGKVYDTRNEYHIDRLADKMKRGFDKDPIQEYFEKRIKLRKKNKLKAVWEDWWQDKKKSNHEILKAAEFGDLELLRKYLDKDKMKDKVGCPNFKGLDDWTPLHFAASNGHLNIVQELLNLKVDIDAVSSI